MKIACPQCGQHYEVEAGMLDRYFRCTECQMLFRGLNAKPVKERKFRRKIKVADAAAAGADVAAAAADTPDLTATTAAVAVEDMAKEAAEAEAKFWEKSLEEDAVAEKAARFRGISFNFMAYLPLVCLILLAVTFVLALVANSKGNDLAIQYQAIDNKGIEYKDQLTKLEHEIGKLQNSVQNMNKALEKLDRVFDHVNTKVNDQTLARKVDELGTALSRSSDDIKRVSMAVNECQEELKKLSDAEKAPAKVRKTRR